MKSQDAVTRMTTLLSQSNDIGSIEDLLADIIHYCKSNDLDFNDLLNTAKQYVTEEESFDAEMQMGLIQRFKKLLV